MQLRKSRVTDVPLIYELLTELGQKGLLLPRSLSELYDVVRDFFVAHPDGEPETLAGTCALHICWADLGEVRSLAVDSSYCGQDLGRRLVEECIAEAREIGLKRLFALTYIPDYFMKFDFKLIEKNELPQKIWADCFKCVKFPECNEVALVKDL
ncbi:MAG: N-acetyltransferase [Deltaproteobacteria bacterium]|nr:N-acetyltransferase [Deltaproteobacteria bacterium]MBW2051302.1 N-acetyltransferase [Deltaproteobacteria bacterium]MBW2141347.1 N-acetyltransferase [Deltaproteobacteria bacterium]MBW2322996.1 N-acetyltransferase [Deltaproteobacteria bacterium]